MVDNIVLVGVVDELELADAEAYGVELRYGLTYGESRKLGEHGLVGAVGRDAKIDLTTLLNVGAAAGILRKDDAAGLARAEDGILDDKVEVKGVVLFHEGDVLPYEVGQLVLLTLSRIDADEEEDKQQQCQGDAQHDEQVEEPRITFEHFCFTVYGFTEGGVRQGVSPRCSR